MSNWDTLGMSDKASLIKLFLKNGVKDLKQMRDSYNQLSLFLRSKES